MAQQNIVLIGMPGAGKSTIGVLLAKTLGMAFIDTDLVIQERSGRLLQEIIDQDGVADFLTLEEKVICELQVKKSVIATGGSVVHSKEAV
ncbi:MAG TPA: shikimate kinase, partial [Firmicutes bacterium]|nr:shikimate kinase [Bacillota bacterium]